MGQTRGRGAMRPVRGVRLTSKAIHRITCRLQPTCDKHDNLEHGPGPCQHTAYAVGRPRVTAARLFQQGDFRIGQLMAGPPISYRARCVTFGVSKMHAPLVPPPSTGPYVKPDGPLEHLLSIDSLPRRLDRDKGSCPRIKFKSHRDLTSLGIWR